VNRIRRFGAFVAGLVIATLISSAGAQAQDYPTRPIRLIVAFTAGGTTDFMARLVADKLKNSLGQSVIVENRPGANGAIAAEYVAKAEPDGYTLFFTTWARSRSIRPAQGPALRPDPGLCAGRHGGVQLDDAGE